MDLCLICGESLYKEITFSNIFRFHYTVHDKCFSNLKFNSDSVVIPIMNNIIIYDFLFHYISEGHNRQYLEQEYMHRIYERNLFVREWSILIYYEKGLFDDFHGDDYAILFSLSNNPFLVISFSYSDLSDIVLKNL